MEKRGWPEIRLGIPPVAGTGRATAGTQNALIHSVKLLSVRLALQNLLSWRLRWILPLQPRFNRFILVVKVGHIHNKILDHKHVWQGGNHSGRPRWDLGQTSKPISTVNVHSAGTTDSLTAGATEGQGWVDLVLDLD